MGSSFAPNGSGLWLHSGRPIPRPTMRILPAFEGCGGAETCEWPAPGIGKSGCLIPSNSPFKTLSERRTLAQQIRRVFLKIFPYGPTSLSSIVFPYPSCLWMHQTSCHAPAASGNFLVKGPVEMPAHNPIQPVAGERQHIGGVENGIDA